MCLAKSPCLGKRCCGQSGIQNGLDAAVPRSLWYAEWAILCTCICCYITCYITSYIRLLYIEIYNMFFKLHTNFAAHPPSPPGSSADACKLETHPRAPPWAQLFAACCFAWCSSSCLLVFVSATDTFTCKKLRIWNYFFLHFSTPPPLPHCSLSLNFLPVDPVDLRDLDPVNLRKRAADWEFTSQESQPVECQDFLLVDQALGTSW